MKRLLVFAVVLLAATFAVATFGYGLHPASGEKLEVVIPEAELQNNARKQFPITRTYLGFLSITYADPIVILEDKTNRLRVGLTATSRTAGAGDLGLAGKGLFSGSLRYKPGQGAFYLNDIKLESLDLPGFSGTALDQAKDFTSRGLKQYYATHPVYVLDRHDLKQNAARLVLRSVDVRDRSLVIGLGVAP
ncbi:MAG: DUF1439 domain-containing protein [Verrucomicrobiae bacterium]|nr:DUF1439 domain-containing protein [Verrucomicrobiae bacterium]